MFSKKAEKEVGERKIVGKCVRKEKEKRDKRLIRPL